MYRPLRRTERAAQVRISRGCSVIAGDIDEQGRELLEAARVELTCGLDALFRAPAQKIQAPALARDTDDRNVESVAVYHRMQRRKYFLVGEISGGTEEHQGIRTLCVHGFKFHAAARAAIVRFPPAIPAPVRRRAD